MADPSRRRRDRASSKERLRGGFYTQATQQLQELAGLVEGDADQRESVVYELERMADTAESLDLTAIAEAARKAGEEVQGGATAKVLGKLARKLRIKGVTPLFPPIAIVAPGVESLESQVKCYAEQIRIVNAVEDLFHQIWFDDLQACIVPVKPRRDLQRLTAEAPGQVYAWGPPGDFKKHLTAVKDGAAGYFSWPLDLDSVLERVRIDTQRRVSSGPRILLAAGEDDEDAEELAQILSERRIHVGDVCKAEELVPWLERFCPAVMVVTSDIEGAAMDQAAQLVRNHERCTHLPIIYVSADAVPDHIEAIVEEVVDPDYGLDEVAQRVQSHLQRSQGGGGGRDPLTWLPNRAAILASLDRELARARRTQETLAVALVDVDGLKQINLSWGRTAGDEGLRLVADVLSNGLRAYDLVGRVGSDAFLVALPTCTAESAITRIIEIQNELYRRASSDPRLAELTFSAGVADSQFGLDSVLSRADSALCRLQTRFLTGTVESDR